MSKKLLLISLLLIQTLLTSCEEKPEANITIKSSIENNEIVELHDTYQQQYLSSDNPSKAYKNIYNRNSIPQDVNIKWTCDSNVSIDKLEYKFEFSKNSNLENSFIYTTNDLQVYLVNLEINTQYYYEITTSINEKNFTSGILSFMTCNDGLRLLNVDGVKNIRDIGGGNVRQGLIYRSAQFNYDEEDSQSIKSKPTEKGLKTLLEDLKIKSDIDIRDVDETCNITSSPLGDMVTYKHFPMVFGGKNIFTTASNKESIKLFLEYCSEPSSYPMVFHCSRGADRTGGLAYVLGALGGNDELRLLQDYYFTSFGDVGTIKDIYGTSFYQYQINNTEGETLQEKTKKYLIDKIGVEEETLNKIIDIISVK